MKNRLLWIAIVAVGLAALYFGIARPEVSTVPRKLRETVSDLKPAVPPPLAPPELIIPPTPVLTPPLLKPTLRIDPILGRPEVPIQNAATIDFSTGAPHVKVDGKDREALESALKEIADVAERASIKAKQ